MRFHDPSWCARLNARPAPESAEPAPRPAPLKRREIPAVHLCDLCGATMYDHNCKIVCPNCGYKRDCSDP
jgi:rubrerythrin